MSYYSRIAFHLISELQGGDIDPAGSSLISVDVWRFLAVLEAVKWTELASLSRYFQISRDNRELNKSGVRWAATLEI